MKKLLFAIFLLSFAATKAGQSIKLDKNQGYYCYHGAKNAWHKQNGTYSPSEWEKCKTNGSWKFVGKDDNKTYCESYPSDQHDCIL